MDIKKNLLLAKKYMVENIYNAANIEGIAMTFPETQTICDGMSVSGKTVDEINAVCDLKRAYQWVFENHDTPLDIESIKKINELVGKYTIINAGSIRTAYDEPIRVMINDGKYYYPPLPKAEAELNNDINVILENTTIDKYTELFCYICKSQLFMDGNKRTATIAVEMSMIKDGAGLFSIPSKDKENFYLLLADFYENDSDKEKLKSYLKQNCILYNEKLGRAFPD